ncbi:MAG: AAA family ATPase [Verrucomicrobia bacterium]|nr:AAA family ATPase [Verrucomicrobiota bacterium]
MILHSLELTHVGRFRDTVRLGPLTPGLNVLSAPNEAGKSTALHAAARALFDRHSTRSEEIKALQPAGTALAPRVVVEFETHAGRFRLAKTFLQKPECHLHQQRTGVWELIAEADAADQRVQSLLQSSLPGRGATKSEHWGFLGFLWARQGEPTTWPGLDDADVGQRIRARLARVELDPVIEQLRLRLATATEAIITATGQSRAGGPLREAEDDLAAVEANLASLRQTRNELDEAFRRFQQSEAEVARLEKEHTERSASAATLREQSLAAERLRGELDARQQALATAQEKLTAVAADADALARLQRDQAETKISLAQARTSAQTAEQALLELRTRLDQAQSEQPRHETALQSLRSGHQRLQSLIKLRELSASAIALAKQLKKAEATSAAIAALEAKKTQLPTLTPAKLKKLEELAESIHTLRTRLQALGLTVELTPDKKATVENHTDPASPSKIFPAGKTARMQSPQALDLQLVGWGRVVIRSGSHDAQSVAADLAQAEADLQETLQQTGVSTLEAAREAVTARKDIEAQLKTATAALEPHLGDHETLDDLRQAVATATRRAEALTASIVATDVEQARSLTDLEAAEAAQGESVTAAESALAAFNKQLTKLRTEERDASQTAQQASKQVSEHESRGRTLEAQIKSISDRYPDGIDGTKTAAQVAFAQAEARVVATKADLPADFEKLPERNKRAAASLQQIVNDLQARRTDRDQAEATLEILGGQGLYSRETELEEKKAEAILRRDAARARGWSARVAHDLIEHRKQAATKAVLAPLEQRLTTAFAELTGDSVRQVFLDERLQIAGIGRNREEAYAFDQLSQGAKEQLLLCLRLAVAQELATEEPQVLILDDVLVNTDPVRQDRILDVLGAQAARLQILILTCHPERYRGIGTSTKLNSTESNQHHE